MNVSVELAGVNAARVSEAASQACSVAKRLEESGMFDEAAESLAPFWHGVMTTPNIGGMDSEVAGRVILRAGVLNGYIGNTRQISDSQDFSKDLISKAIRLFQELGDATGEADAHIELAQCFLRLGELDNGRVHINEALKLAHEADVLTRGKASLVLSMIEGTGGQLHECMSILLKASTLFAQIDNDYLKGCYHMAVGNIFSILGEAENRHDYIDRALSEYPKASDHLEKIGHIRFCSMVESNHGCAFQHLGRYLEGEERLYAARRNFNALKDIGAVAVIDEAIARGKVEQKEYKEAVRVAQGSVGLLRNGESPARLAEALTTLGVAHARLGNELKAKESLNEAIYIAELAGNLSVAGRAALAILEEFELDFQERAELHLKTIDFFRDNQEMSVTRRMRTVVAKLIRLALDEVSSLKKRHSSDVEIGEGFSLEAEVRKYEERLIIEAMSQANGRISHAAKLLGISHQALDNKLKRQFQNVRFMQTHRHRDSQKQAASDSAPAAMFPEHEYLQVFVMPDESFAPQGIHAGDRLLVEQQEAANGKPVVVSYDGGTYAGFYFIEAGKIKLKAGDNSLEDIYIENPEACKIEGVIVGYVERGEDLGDAPLVKAI